MIGHTVSALGTIAGVSLVTVLAISSATAQVPHFSLGGSGVSTQIERQRGAVREDFTGAILGGEAWVSPRQLPMLELNLAYAQGTLESTVGPQKWDFAEGEALIGFRPVPWLAVRTGPHVRSNITAQGTERWFFWEGRLVAEATVLAPALRSYLEITRVLVADVNVQDQFDNGTGIEAGFELASWDLPLWARLAYRLERGSLAGGSRLETVEQLIISLGYQAR